MPANTALASEEGKNSNTAELSFGLLPSLLGYQLRRAQMAIFRHFADTVPSDGMSPGLLGMLQMIGANPGLSQSRLAEAMGVDRSIIVKVVRQLEGRGLIERIGAADDRRRNCLHPTPAGRQMLARLEADILRHEKSFAAGLTADERRTLLRLLSRLHYEPTPKPR